MDPNNSNTPNQNPDNFDQVKGGAGMYGSTSDWGMAKFGQNQMANASGSIAVKGGDPKQQHNNGGNNQNGGVGLTESVVPVVLFLANANSKKLLSQSGLSAKQLKGGKLPSLPEGGSLANSIAVPAVLVLASHYFGKNLKSRRQRPSFGTKRSGGKQRIRNKTTKRSKSRNKRH